MKEDRGIGHSYHRPELSEPSTRTVGQFTLEPTGLPSRISHPESGRTLIELIATIVIIGVVAAVAMPVIDRGQSHEIDLAVVEVTSALRYSAELARFSGSYHGVTIDKGEQQLKLFRLDETMSPGIKVFDVVHPVTKQLYVLEFGRAPIESVTLAGIETTASGACDDTTSYVFDSYGVVRCMSQTTSRFESPSIDLRQNGAVLSVKIDGYIGRVSSP